jgi:hypothetical protein
MAVGIIVPLPAYTLHPAFLASQAEALGFESLWYHEPDISVLRAQLGFMRAFAQCPAKAIIFQ